MTEPKDPGFYVGYLPSPAPVARFTRSLIVALVLLVVALAGTFAALQQDPGPGVWDTANTVTLTGTLRITPYPVLVPDNPADAHTLVISEGKNGASARLRPYANQRITLRGTIMTRAGYSLMTLPMLPDAVEASADQSAPQSPTEPPASERVTLRGRIADPQCWLGAMKPGEGKSHRSCAALCIAGGIPPILLVDGPSPSTPTLVILANSLTQGANRRVLPYIDEPIQVTGSLTSIGEWGLLTIDESGLRRRSAPSAP